MSDKTLMILGATSDIGKAAARHFAREGYSIQLAGRDVNELNRIKLDLQIRFDVDATIYQFDVLNLKSHSSFINELSPLPTVAICLIGYLGVQKISEQNLEERSLVVRTNLEGPINILSILANKFEERGNGIIFGVSSVAGDRGRQSNYIYGASKAGFTAFLSGLRARLSQRGVQVITVLPGFVDTKMTEHMDLPPLLTAKPEKVAKAIFDAMQNNRDIIYVKRIWFFIMLIIRNIPEFIFKKTTL